MWFRCFRYLGVHTQTEVAFLKLLTKPILANVLTNAPVSGLRRNEEPTLGHQLRAEHAVHEVVSADFLISGPEQRRIVLDS